MKKWTVSSPDRKIVSALTLGSGGSISPLAAAVLASRGYTDCNSVSSEFSVSADELSDPFLINDMQSAADTINEAIDSGEKICVYGDYDCDGIMASVMLYSYLYEAGADVEYYIPERSEGYGLNAGAVRKIADGGVGLIITVDNGISAISEAELVYECGMKLVITDHHQPGEILPRAEAVVDLHRSDCFVPFKELCGAGVVLKLIAALDGGDYTMALEQFGDLAAIATVADIVSLKNENRFIVNYGMNLIENSDRPAICALKAVSGLEDKKIDTVSIGFNIAPRINASGRFGSPSTAVKLFLSEDDAEITNLAAELNELNSQRKNKEAEIMKEICAMIDADPMMIRERVIFICGKNWHHGVIGIVASRVSEMFGKPAFIASESDGEIRGSARSFGEFSVFGALSACSDSLEKFGGHPGAGGFTIRNGMTDEFNRLLRKYAIENHKIMPVMTIRADAPITAAELDIQYVRGLSFLEPFGAGNEKPLFYIESAVVTDITPLSGGTHTKLRLKIGYVETDALLFRTAPDSLMVNKGDMCSLIVSVGINSFRGNESISMVVKDYRSCNVVQSKVFAAASAFEAFLRGEKLPDNYYPSMYPTREETAEIYKQITAAGISADLLSSRIRIPSLNQCKFLVALEAMRELGLISYSSAEDSYRRNPVSRRVDLQSAPILGKLKSHFRQRQTVLQG